MTVERLFDADVRSARPSAATRGRVAHCVRAFGEPSQTFVADAILELDRLGWEVWVVARHIKHRDWFPHPPDARVLTGRRPPFGQRIGGRLLLRSAAQRRSCWLDPVVRDIDPALIHAHFGWTACDVAPLARRLGVPLVVSFHGTDVTAFPRTRTGARAYRDLANRADRLIAVSGAHVQRLRSLGFEQPIDVVPAGVRLSEFGFREHAPDTDEVRLLFVGRQAPVKGLDVLLEALPLVREQEPRVRLEVVGDGPDRERNEALATRLGIAPLVEFRGTQPRAEVRAALCRSHVAVVPSRTTSDGQMEGSPVLTKEALAIGVATVGTTVGGLPETIAPRYRPELVPEEDPEALAGRILAVIGDRVNWDERAALGRRWVEEEFEWARLARRIENVYEAALEAR